MHWIASTFAVMVVGLASGLAAADGVDWVAKGSNATLIPGGRDAQGTTLNVCRATTETSVAIGKFWTSGEHAWECRVGAGAREQSFPEFEVLAAASSADASFKWVPGHATSYPQHAVVAGQAADGARWLVCAGLNLADHSVHPGYIFDDGCVYAYDGRQVTADTYLVLAANDPEIATTEDAQPALEGFDPGAILGVQGMAAFCALAEGLCAPALPTVGAPAVANGN